ncbi:MAG: insulinase family protein [Acidobacteria bacterium]|nr:insulinase family protein [Acidobacteriota bacterium]
MPNTHPRKLARRASNCAGLFCALLVAGLASAATLPRVPIHQEILENGLRVLMVERHEAPVVSVQVWYHVGSKNERPGRTGFAHLFEHLMFQGTKNLGPDQFSDYIVRAGGLDNAYTTEDYTVYWETIPSSQLPVALWLEADRMRNLEITERSFNTEIEVVKEERRLRFDNQPYGTVVEQLYAHAFSVHPYRHSAIGSMEDLDRARLDDIRAFYDTYYVPNNATLIIAGDFDRREAESLVRQYFGPLSPGTERPQGDIPEEPRQIAKRLLTLRENVALPAFVAAYHMPADGTPDAYPLRLAAKILSEGESSRIYRRLVYEKEIAFEAHSTGNFTEDPNLFFVLAVMNPGHTPQEGEAEVQAELDRLKNGPPPAEDLVKAKNQILRDFVLSRQTVHSLAEELGYAAVVLKDPELLNTELDRFLTVTPEDIQRVARKYFVPENVTVVEVYPRSEQDSQVESLAAPAGNER